jgi:hypothetical protein
MTNQWPGIKGVTPARRRNAIAKVDPASRRGLPSSVSQKPPSIVSTVKNQPSRLHRDDGYRNMFRKWFRQARSSRLLPQSKEMLD